MDSSHALGAHAASPAHIDTSTGLDSRASTKNAIANSSVPVTSQRSMYVGSQRACSRLWRSDAKRSSQFPLQASRNSQP